MKNQVVGILGGGQLARMLGVAAAKLGIKIIILEPQKNAPAAQVANQHIVAEYENKQALQKMANACDVITYEFENVPLASAEFLEKHSMLFPPAKALEISQDRLLEKQFLQSLGFSLAPFCAVNSVADLQFAFKEFGKGILKATRFGYDGKGQYVIENETLPDIDFSQKFVFEKFQNFEFEFSIIACRGQGGEIIFYDAARNVHKNGILHTSTVPADLPPELEQEAQMQVMKLLHELNYVGVIGVEFFCVGGEVVVNEIAPRVHNSGHWTEICTTSQFAQHIRAICNLPLGTTARSCGCKMINLIGDDINTSEKWLGQNALLTLYGKEEVRAGRKMGHVIVAT